MSMSNCSTLTSIIFVHPRGFRDCRSAGSRVIRGPEALDPLIVCWNCLAPPPCFNLKSIDEDVAQPPHVRTPQPCVSKRSPSEPHLAGKQAVGCDAELLRCHFKAGLLIRRYQLTSDLSPHDPVRCRLK